MPPAAPPALVLTDIEGTVVPIAFVHRVLFPYARDALPALLAHTPHPPGVARALAEVAELAPGREPLAQLLAWMDEGAKVVPLKVLQGIAWAQGYAAGALRGTLYPDVAPALRRWRAAGVRLAVFSSGSEDAQRLVFGHSTDGDLSGLFNAYFDTRIGAKREAGSFRELVRRLGAAPGTVLFLSDVAQELDAAAAAGLLTCQLVRPDDGTAPGPAHPVAGDFEAVSRLFGLPAAP